MALRKLVAGNWKMNGTRANLPELHGIAAAGRAAPGVDVLIAPPYTLIDAARAAEPGLAIGAQDCHHIEQGAHTGCIAAVMIADLGATHVIVGHSERRAAQRETDRDVRAKAEAAIAAGLIPIICVGETEAERDAGRAIFVIANQLDGSVPPIATAETLIVAYEPRWAIGTGRTPSIGEVSEMHGLIRAKLDEMLGTEGAAVRILYGGSVTEKNAAALMAVPEVDGVLVGGASLTAESFVPIIEAAARV